MYLFPTFSNTNTVSAEENTHICIHGRPCGSSHLVKPISAPLINTNSHHIVPLNATVTSPFSPFQSPTKERTLSLKLKQPSILWWASQLRVPLSPNTKSTEYTSWCSSSETKSSINADLSLRKPRIVSCSTLHYSFRLLSSSCFGNTSVTCVSA